MGDQLYACVTSVLDNLIEAGLHWLEFLDYSEQESDMFAGAVRLHGSELVVSAPRRERPLDHLVGNMCELHSLGVARSLSGALDCLAGAIVGVVALKTSILRADFRRVKDTLDGMAEPAAEGERAQARFGSRLGELIENAGPPGWLPWLLDFRNMLMHRGRRVIMSQLAPRPTMLFGPDGQRIPRTRVVRQLPSDPGRSDIEVLLEPHLSPVVTEYAEETLQGLVQSTRQLVDTAAGELRQFWAWRRANPKMLPQPAEQWKDGVSMASTGFSGYSPGSFPYSPSTFLGHPVMALRLRTAALDDRNRAHWPTFD